MNEAVCIYEEDGTLSQLVTPANMDEYTAMCLERGLLYIITDSELPSNFLQDWYLNMDTKLTEERQCFLSDTIVTKNVGETYTISDIPEGTLVMQEGSSYELEDGILEFYAEEPITYNLSLYFKPPYKNQSLTVNFVEGT